MLSPYEEQLAAIRNRNAYDTRVATAANGATPATAAAVAAQGQAYPHLQPQTAYALGAGGYTPGDQVSNAVATASLNKQGGGFWHSLGHIVTAPLRAAAHLAEAGIHDVGAVTKIGVRTALTAAETPFQVGTGIFRDVAAVGGDIVAGAESGAAIGAGVGLAAGGIGAIPGAIGGAVAGGIAGGVAQAKGVKIHGGVVNPLSQSTGGLALEHLVSGKPVDLGSGFLPAGAIHEEQIKNAQQAASVNGYALTPGRFVASALARPGTTPYNVLSGVGDAVTSWELDPTRYLTEEYAAQREAAKLIPGAATAEAGPLTALARRAGLLATADPAVATDAAREFLTTDGAAQRFIAKAAETSSPSEIVAASKGKMPVAIANQLAAANTPQDVTDILLSAVEGAGLKEKAAVQAGRSLTSTFTNYRPGARIAETMNRLGAILPEHSVDLLDLDKAPAKLDKTYTQMDRFLTQARYSAADKAPILDRLASANTPEDAARVFDTTINGHLRDRLLAAGMPDEKVDQMLTHYSTDVRLLHDQAVSELADNTVAKAFHDGEDLHPVIAPNQQTEYLKYTVNLPDPRTVRQLTTPTNTKIGESLSALYNSDGWKTSTHAADALMGGFKKAVTVRPALAVRTMVMQHTKMAAEGLESRFSVPNLIRMATNPDFRKAVEEGVLDGDVLTKAEAYQSSLRKISGHITNEDQAAHQIVVGPGHDLFPQAWTSRIAEHHADPVARSIAGQGTEATAQAFWDGPLAAERERLAVDLNRPVLLSDRAAADAYVRDTVAKNISTITADNPHVLEAIATGKIPVYEGFEEQAANHIPLLADGPDTLVNPDAVRHLEDMAVDQSIRVPTSVPAAGTTRLTDPDYGNKIGRMTNWFYSTMINKPMAFFYQSPALNQLYWKELAGQAHLLDAEGIEKLSARIGTQSNAVRIPAEARTALERAIANPNAGSGKVMLSHLDELAKARAVDGLQAMTIDMARKTGWQDAARLMVPFGKHWQQELAQWSRLAVDNPTIFRKAQMTIDGGIGSGFFHTDANGQYVFHYPGSELVSKVLTGTPTPMSAKVGGLSAFTTDILPGFGPMVSVPASKLIPNKPEWDEVRNFLAPHGDPTLKGSLSLVEPSWAKTLQTALSDPQNDRDAANTTMQVARYLVSTGKFSTDTPEEQQRLLTDAGSRAKKLLILQALGKFVLPSTPNLEAVAKMGPGDGRTVTAKLLSDDLQAMRQADYEHSTENFIGKYGESALLFLQGATRPLVPGAGETTEQSAFLRAHPELADALPNSGAFFAPQGSQTFDPTSIARQINTGQRQSLTPAQQVQLANDQVGSLVYYNAKAQLGPHINQAQSAILAQLKQALMKKYPGFNVAITGLGARVTDDPTTIQSTVIPELRKALTIPATADSDTGRALAKYMELRDGIEAIAEKRGLRPGSFAQAQSAADMRAVLRKYADTLGRDNAGFAMLFDRLLDRELRTDATPQPVAAT